MSAVPSTPPRAGDDEYAVPAEEQVYARFLAAVVSAQVRNWLPPEPVRILDISRHDVDRGTAHLSAIIGRSEHSVVRVLPGLPGASRRPGRPTPAGLTHVVGDPRSLDWFRAGRVDALVAEGSALSSCLATEETVAQAARILRPGGRLLLSVDSLLYGLARLAEQRRWPELADAGAADVVLVPAKGGTVTLCFGPEELSDLVAEAGHHPDHPPRDTETHLSPPPSTAAHGPPAIAR